MNFEETVNTFSKTLRRYIVYATNNSSFVDDILQDVFIKLYQNVDSLKSSEKVKSWLYSVTKNTIIDYYRKEKKTEILQDDLYVQKHELSCYDEIGECILGLLLNTQDEYVQIIKLYEYKGLTAQEIANILNLPLPTVKSKINRGRKKLKQTLLECCEFENDKNGAPISFNRKQTKSSCSC